MGIELEKVYLRARCSHCLNDQFPTAKHEILLDGSLKVSAYCEKCDATITWVYEKNSVNWRKHR